ncbi:L-type lectin-domain containing receptor kinase IX.1-like [Salvia splendens]|uniref:L-type lectin-domain containing receptor kinase IX.1-like n=1 Tax=Salvia splendens TaxID=180675 RepID=UPI001C267472|nr:L-type lectin-domain containing receptor kinase IX.1-like [Salvia splendens]
MAPYFSIYLLLLITTSTASPLSFNLPVITPDQANLQIMLEGDAQISEEGLQLTTKDIQVTGRATYAEPLHLWDKPTGNLTDFNTYFSFVIQATNYCLTDGLAFFLAPVNSTIPENSSGSSFGLAPTDTFVAVEFDTVSDLLDPLPGSHVGIDVMSLNSVMYKPWRKNLTEGDITDAWISYNSSNMKFLVNFTNNVELSPFSQTYYSSVEYTIDLRTILPEFVEIGFSAATGSCFQRNNVKSWSFNSTLDLKIEDTQSNFTGPDPEDTRPPSNETGPAPEPAGKPVGLIAGISTAAAVGLVLVGYWLWRRKRGGRNGDEEEGGDVSAMEMDFQKGSGPRRFSYGELAAATGNFAEESKLGEGGFGGVYRGFLKNLDSYVAVKRVSKTSKQGAKEYASEVTIISRLRHRNLVQLIGWCHEKRELLVVYELQPNGSLDSHLFNKKNPPLNWETRFKIARGLAAALQYLHEDWEQCVVHRDIKSSNVMLDSAFNAKLGDFGLARLVDHNKGSQTTILAGTMGYMAPECVMTGRASKESDVYSFGIVALEISTGRQPIWGKVRTVERVWELYGTGRTFEAADGTLEGCGGYIESEMERLMVVGLWCAHPDYGLRPSMKEVVRVLGFEAVPPPLPSKMPVPTYGTPPPPSSIPSLIYASDATYSSSGYSYGSTTTSSSGASVSASASASLLFTR